MFKVQCLNPAGELVIDKEYNNIISMRVFTEGELVTMIARGEIKTVLIDVEEEK
jgi:hypothetical protein